MKGATDGQTEASLAGVDWNFPAVTTLATSVHALHWFPGNFIPQIPLFLVQALSRPGDLIADPFCGSGTTGIEAALVGRKAWLGDHNAISSLITRAKIHLLTDAALRTDFSRYSRSVLWEATTSGSHSEGPMFSESVSEWFHPDTFAQLTGIWNAIQTLRREGCRTVLEMLFSDALFSCVSTGRPLTSGGGKRKHHWGWIADNVRPKAHVWHDARRLFQSRIIRAEEVIRATPLVERERLHFQLSDARQVPLQDESVGAVITSPPYLGMVDYANANRLTYAWLGLDIKEDRKTEIGARLRRNNVAEPERYLIAMRGSAEEITRILRPNGFCAIVIGSSRKFPGMAADVINIFAQTLKTFFGPVARTPTRRRVSAREATSATEFVCVFQKPS